MATTFSYGYTLETYVDWKQSAATLPPLPIDTGSGGFDPTLYPDLVPIQTEALNTTTVKSFEIQNLFTVHYLVRVYQIKNVNGTKTYYRLSGTDVGTGLHMSFGQDAKYFGLSGPIGAHTNTDVSHITVANPGKGPVYWFTVKANQPVTAITNYITITSSASGGIDPQNFADGPYGGDNSPSPTSDTVLVALQTTPTVTIGGSKPTPPYPNNFTTYLQSQAPYTTQPGGQGGIVQAVYDPCKNVWWGLVIGSTDYTKSTIGTFGYGLYTATLNGDQYSFKPSGTPKTNVKANSAPDLKVVQSYRDILQQARAGDCVGITSNRVSSAGSGGTGGGGNQNPPQLNVGDLSGRWNPPPHKATKNPPYLPISKSTTEVQPFYTVDGSVYGPDIVNELVVGYSNLQAMAGRIYQDPNGAATLNTNPDKLKNLPGIGKGQTTAPWGFRFMYNPTSFSYSTASSNNVDWTLGKSDPAILLQGNQNVSFELYLNRIVDLSYLQNYTPGSGKTLGAYGPGGLSDVDAQGILNRGTEYDIEFLYRVLNGDPLGNSQLLSEDYRNTGETADFGYTTGTPCWLALNENLRYFGSVANLSVNHVLFDIRMVPMLTVVNISFSRYPALWTDPLAGKNNSATKAGTESDFIAAIGASASTGTP